MRGGRGEASSSACNSASSVALDAIAEHGIPVIGVIEPGARRAAARSKSRRIGVIGTRATIGSGAYQRAIEALRPDAEVLAHPECDQAVLDQADFIASTTGIIKRAVESEAKTLIIATEDGVFHQIHQQAPEKELIQAPGMDESCACNQCPFMRLNTLEKLYLCLRDLSPQIEVPESIRTRALAPIERELRKS